MRELESTVSRPAGLHGLKERIVGGDALVPLAGGGERPYVYLDNAASTPAFTEVAACVNEALVWYSGVHRGAGFKSQLCTELYGRSREALARLIGADPSCSCVIFTRNTTDAINKLANRLDFGPDDVTITTMMEHHSNDLPWRKRCEVVHVPTLPDGRLDLCALQEAIAAHAGRLRLVSITGASNVTGVCPPVHEIAQWAHAAGAWMMVDAAQLIAHRPVQMLPDDDPAHIDFLALSGHKMYAPFGAGALVGPRRVFEDGDPDVVGGGAVDIVTLDEVTWSQPPHKEEAGSPNVLGVAAMAEASATLRAVGMEKVAAHESDLLRYALERLSAIEGVRLYGPVADLSDRVGVITFNVGSIPHELVAAILSAECGIGVRDGCFCAHTYVKRLLGLTSAEERKVIERIRAGDRSSMPGMVRASLGCYSDGEDIDALAEAVERIAREQYKCQYTQDPVTGQFSAVGFTPDCGRYLPFLNEQRW